MCEIGNEYCKVGECTLQCYELITSWVRQADDESSQCIKTYSDILRRKFDLDMLKTLCKRTPYKGVFTFADWCYVSGSLVDVEELPNGYFKVKLPKCVFDVYMQAWSEFVDEFYHIDLGNYDDTSIYGRVIDEDTAARKSLKSVCPYAPKVDAVTFYESPIDFGTIKLDTRFKRFSSNIEELLEEKVVNGT